MFISPILYVVYAIITGIGFALADIFQLRVHSFGFIEFITRVPMMVNAGLVKDLINFFISCAAFFGINYFTFNFLIRKFNIGTPGRKGNYIDSENEEVVGNTKNKATANDEEAIKIISLLGEKDNIEEIDACMTRLRVTVKDPSKVANQAEWKKNGAIGLIRKDNGIQAIYGPKADILKSTIQDILGV